MAFACTQSASWGVTQHPLVVAGTCYLAAIMAAVLDPTQDAFHSTFVSLTVDLGVFRTKVDGHQQSFSGAPVVDEGFHLSWDRPSRSPSHPRVITACASIEVGWPSTVGVQSLLFCGLWSRTVRQQCHITLLELRAIKLTCCASPSSPARWCKWRASLHSSQLPEPSGRHQVLGSVQQACSLHRWVMHRIVSTLRYAAWES